MWGQPQIPTTATPTFLKCGYRWPRRVCVGGGHLVGRGRQLSAVEDAPTPFRLHFDGTVATTRVLGAHASHDGGALKIGVKKRAHTVPARTITRASLGMPPKTVDRITIDTEGGGSSVTLTVKNSHGWPLTLLEIWAFLFNRPPPGPLTVSHVRLMCRRAPFMCARAGDPLQPRWKVGEKVGERALCHIQARLLLPPPPPVADDTPHLVRSEPARHL